MGRNDMIIPNLVLLGFAILMYYETLLVGQVTMIGLLLITSALLPILLRIINNRWIAAKIAAVCLNACLFAMSGYMFCGSSYLLFRHNIFDVTVYILLLIMWLLAVIAIITKNRSLYFGFVMLLTICSVFGLYLFSSNQWNYPFNPTIPSLVMLISLLNVYYIFLKIRNQFRQKLKN